MASMITSLTGNIMDGITIVLVAFAGISLVVSMIMIGIIIYISYTSLKVFNSSFEYFIINSKIIIVINPSIIASGI